MAAASSPHSNSPSQPIVSPSIAPPPPPLLSGILSTPADSPSALGSVVQHSNSSTPPANLSPTSPPPVQTPPPVASASPPSTDSSTLSPPPQSAPPPVTSVASPPPSTTTSPPPDAPPPSSPPPPPPLASSPPPPPPLVVTTPPAASPGPPPSPPSPPPPPSSSSSSSPPRSSSSAPVSSPPPPSSTPPSNSPSPSPPPPPPSSTHPPPPPSTQRKSPPPPASTPSPSSNSPPPPSSKNSPPPAPGNSPPPPTATPPSSSSGSSPPPSGSHSPSTSSTAHPAPVSHISPSSSPSRLSPPPPLTNTTTNSSSGASSSAGSSSKGGFNTGAIVAIAVAVGFLLTGLILCAVLCRRKRRRRLHGLDDGSDIGFSPRSDSNLIAKTDSGGPVVGSGSGGDGYFSPSDHGGLGNSRSWFTYEELFEATNGFSAENLLGKGGFGSVYKGLLADGKEVAVKQLNIGGGQGDREFKAEVEIISRIHHRHLVSLVGYCISESRRLLVYDYVPNNTLYYHLHKKGVPVMDWPRRFKIAAGAARGIAYLHEDCHPQIIHRDIKSSNILLDNNFEARVSDFGLAKFKLDADTHVSTRVMGTFGYMAPEYATSGKLTEKSDVYSFGVVLLELITGRKPVDASQPEEGLVDWARPLLSHALETEEFGGLVDPRLGENYVQSEVFRMIEAAAACVRHSAVKRPGMGQIVRAFDTVASSDLNNGMKVGESQLYDSAQQSAEIRWFRKMAFGSHEDDITDFFTEPTQNVGLQSQRSRSVDSSTSGRKASMSRQKAMEPTSIPIHETQNIYYTSENNAGISGDESQNFFDLSLNNPVISRQESQNMYYSDQNNTGTSSQQSQNIYYSGQNNTDTSQQSRDVYYTSQYNPNMYNSSQHSGNIYHSSQQSQSIELSRHGSGNAEISQRDQNV